MMCFFNLKDLSALSLPPYPSIIAPLLLLSLSLSPLVLFPTSFISFYTSLCNTSLSVWHGTKPKALPSKFYKCV